MSRTRLRIAAVAAAALVLGACGGPAGTGSTPEPAASTAASGGAATSTGDSSTGGTTTSAPAPAAYPDGSEAARLLAFSAAGVDGAQVEGSTLSGHVALWFWAPW